MTRREAQETSEGAKSQSPAVGRGKADPLGLRSWWERRSRRAKRLLLIAPVTAGAAAFFLHWTMSMPRESFRGPLPDLDDEHRKLAALLRRDVSLLAGEIGERNTSRSGSLDRAWSRLEGEFVEAGYAPKSHPFTVDGKRVANLEAIREGSGAAQEVVVVGAHYDSAVGAPGADDNASGVAVMLELARAFEVGSRTHPRRTIRFVAFVNEEPPHFWNDSMGSLHYAKACKQRGDNIVAMLSLESLGYYRDEPGSQKYPPIVSWFFPSRADFVAFVGNLSSRSLVREAIGAFRTAARFPSEGAAMPSFVTGVGWSDQWSFWQVGYPGVMVTDTALFRNPNYHTPNDKPETLDYDRLARVTAGLVAVVGQLAR